MGSTASQEESLRVLSAGSVEPGLRNASEAFARSQGCRVALDWATTPTIRRRIGAGELFDLVILTTDAAAELTEAAHLRPEPHTPVGRVGVGVAVRAHAQSPEISRCANLEQALLDADAVIFTRATSGMHVESMLKRRSLYDRLLPKVKRFTTGPEMMDHLIRSQGNVICLGAMVELMMFHGRGIDYVGALPASLQHFTPYVAARTTRSRNAERAGEFARHLASPSVRAMFVACGVTVS